MINIVITVYALAITLKCVSAQKNIPWLFPLASNEKRTSKISVIIPARNEEEDIESSIRSVLEQEHINIEVVVVNDQSSDRTGEIIDCIAAENPHVKIIQNPPLKRGWLGKCNAMQVGAAVATGDYFLFTDADVIHDSHCFFTVAEAMDRNGYDFISLFPRFENRSFWENVNLPIYLFGIAKLLAAVGPEDPESSTALASGALMIIKKEVFNEIGGFERVKKEMLDDIGLARLLKRKGYAVGYRLAPDCLKVRLFKNNLDAFWGTTKNILTAVEGHLWLAVPLIVVGILQNWAPLAAMGTGLFKSNIPLLLSGITAYLIQYISFFSIRRLIVFHPLKLLFFPMAAIVGTCCVLRALFYHARGSVFWRGREIRVREG